MYIRGLSVTNYRSLKDVRIGSLSPIVILYGDNDTGKSNILSFLEHVFKQKYAEDITETAQGGLVRMRPSGFWRGPIEHFSDNFYKNAREPITFSIVIRFYRREIKSILSLPDEFLNGLSPNDRYDHLQIEGRIDPLEGDRASMTLLYAHFNQTLFFDSGAQENLRYLPGFDNLSLSQTQKLDVFNKVVSRLDNAFLGIPPNRFLTAEKELPKTETATLEAKTFKNWLFQTSLDRDRERVIREIAAQFNAPPFKHGRMSIARVGDDEIEAFVEGNDGLKLPIERKGSGVQQILMILSHVAQSSAPLIGIEELEINLSPMSQISLFDSLRDLVNASGGPVGQIFLTTHSPHIARRNEAQRRGVWMVNGETKVRRPSEAQVNEFFRFPN